jgi:hypothetical protein
MRGAQRLADRLKGMIGSEQSVHVEKASHGRTPCFAPVRFESDAGPGAVVRMRMISATPEFLAAEPIA